MKDNEGLEDEIKKATHYLYNQLFSFYQIVKEL